MVAIGVDIVIVPQTSGKRGYPCTGFVTRCFSSSMTISGAESGRHKLKSRRRHASGGFIDQLWHYLRPVFRRPVTSCFLMRARLAPFDRPLGKREPIVSRKESTSRSMAFLARSG